jgi:uncharacterized LabA/DUF88 family protein
MATNVYVDGMNLYYGALRGTPYRWLDLEKLARVLLPHDEIGRIKYFTARVQDRYPGDRSGERQSVLLRAMRTNPRIDVKLGYFQVNVKWRALADDRHQPGDLFRPHFRPRTAFSWMWTDEVRRRTERYSAARVVVREEKGTDVNLAATLVFDALTGDCTKALVISNDADLAEALVLASRGGVVTGIANPHRRQSSRLLTSSADYVVPFCWSQLEQCRLPVQLVDPRGRQINCPAEWR